MNQVKTQAGGSVDPGVREKRREICGGSGQDASALGHAAALGAALRPQQSPQYEAGCNTAGHGLSVVVSGIEVEKASSRPAAGGRCRESAFEAGADPFLPAGLCNRALRGLLAVCSL